MSRLVGAIAVIIVMLGLLGCGGGDGVAPNGGGPTPHPDNAAVAGRVVQGDRVNTGLARAVVSEPTTGLSTVADDNGNFFLAGLPGGNIQITVAVSITAAYDGATVTVPTTAAQTTNVNFAVLPVAVGTPTGLFINPLNPTVEEGGAVQFTAAVYVGTTKVDVQPTWILSGDAVGTVDATGLVQTLTAGSGLVTAVVGDLVRSTGLVVTGPLPPQITSVLVSASKDLPVPASGGPVTITAAISDADGIQTFPSGGRESLEFEIYLPDGSKLDITPGDPVAGSIYDGTWRYTYNVPPNSNIPGPDGVQAPQLYSVRVAARDRTGAEAFSQFYDFEVAGLDVPPPPA